MTYQQKNIRFYTLIVYTLVAYPTSYLCGHTINWGVSSRQGERNYMEDYFTATQLIKQHSSSTHSHKCYFFGIYDGHGGSAVSEELKDKLPTKFFKAWQKGNAIPDALKHSLEAIENNLKPDKKGQFDSHNNAGSTAIVAVVDHTNKLYCANVGDSRAIVIRNGTVVFSTEDHKPYISKEFYRLAQAGYALDSSRPNKTPRIKKLSLSRTIGDWNTKLTYPGAIICTPDVYTFEITPGDVLIMASDGLWDVLTNQDIALLVKKIMKHGMEPNFISTKIDKKYEITEGNTPQIMQEVAKALREVAHYRESNDNITVIAAHFSSSSQAKKRPKTTTRYTHIDLLIRNAEELQKSVLEQEKNNILPPIDMHLDLIIHNAQELKKALYQAKNHGSPHTLFKYIDESVRTIKSMLKHNQKTLPGLPEVLLNNMSESLQQIKKEISP